MNKQQLRKLKKFLKFCFETHPALESLSYEPKRWCWRLNEVDIYNLHIDDGELFREQDKAWLVEANLTAEVALSVLPFLKQLGRTKYHFTRKELLNTGN